MISIKLYERKSARVEHYQGIIKNLDKRNPIYNRLHKKINRLQREMHDLMCVDTKPAASTYTSLEERGYTWDLAYEKTKTCGCANMRDKVICGFECYSKKL